MQVGFVVLYVTDAQACLDFWTTKVGMVRKSSKTAGPFEIVQVGFADQEFGFELVPLALMADNPSGLDLATPSIGFREADLETARSRFVENGITVSEIGNHSGVESFAFSDNEGRWFAVVKS